MIITVNIKKNIEVCVDSVVNALHAQRAGANRVEFCASLTEGGVTASHAQIVWARKLLQIPLYALIRPRGGDFLYSDIEFDIIKSDIHFCGQSGCDGVVIGALCADGSVDMQKNGTLIDIAKQYGMGVTFHRAFDRCADMFKSLEDIILLGCERILTSGGYNSAIEGINVISRLVQQAKGRISIMAGAGITPKNACQILKETGVDELHGTFRSKRRSNMQYLNLNFTNQSDEYEIWQTDIEKINKVLNILNFEI